MKRSFKTYEEVEDFVNPLMAEGKYVIDVSALENDTSFVVQWLENKPYVAFDGKEYPDEAWMTQDERFILIQDIDPEHCRNILRMLLRQERITQDSMQELVDYIAQEGLDGDMIEDLDEISAIPGNTTHTLH